MAMDESNYTPRTLINLVLEEQQTGKPVKRQSKRRRSSHGARRQSLNNSSLRKKALLSSAQKAEMSNTSAVSETPRSQIENVLRTMNTGEPVVRSTRSRIPADSTSDDSRTNKRRKKDRPPLDVTEETPRTLITNILATDETGMTAEPIRRRKVPRSPPPSSTVRSRRLQQSNIRQSPESDRSLLDISIYNKPNTAQFGHVPGIKPQVSASFAEALSQAQSQAQSITVTSFYVPSNSSGDESSSYVGRDRRLPQIRENMIESTASAEVIPNEEEGRDPRDIVDGGGDTHSVRDAIEEGEGFKAAEDEEEKSGEEELENDEEELEENEEELEENEVENEEELAEEEVEENEEEFQNDGEAPEEEEGRMESRRDVSVSGVGPLDNTDHVSDSTSDGSPLKQHAVPDLSTFYKPSATGNASEVADNLSEQTQESQRRVFIMPKAVPKKPRVQIEIPFPIIGMRTTAESSTKIPTKPSTKAKARTRRPSDDKSHKVNPSLNLPRSLMKSIFCHFSKCKTVTKGALDEVEKVSDKYWQQMAEDLEAYSHHAGRTSITDADMELLFRRQGFVTDKQSLFSLVEKYLPLEYREQIIPMAQAGNKVYPKK